MCVGCSGCDTVTGLKANPVKNDTKLNVLRICTLWSLAEHKFPIALGLHTEKTTDVRYGSIRCKRTCSDMINVNNLCEWCVCVFVMTKTVPLPSFDAKQLHLLNPLKVH